MPNNMISDDQSLLNPLIYTIQELTKVISEEITLLQTRRPKEMEKFAPLKNKLMASYHKEMSELNSRGGLQGSGDGPALRILKKESRLFQAALTQHTRLVKALKTISENMIKAISDEVVKTQNQTSRYGSNGARSPRRLTTSISINQTI